MRNIRIYQPGDYSAGESVTLSPCANQHVAVVLRMKPGESLCLFSGNNVEYYGKISDKSSKKQIIVDINSAKEANKESPCSLHLAQGVSKGERMEMVIQKAVELGVTSITPIITKHCAVKLDKERMEKKQAQWVAIAISACEQCGRNQLPIINPICSFSSYLQECKARLKLILDPQAGKTWRDFTFKESIALIIGPEGGLAEEEIIEARGSEFQPLSLGPRILRTETAAIAALSVLQALSGDL